MGCGPSTSAGNNSSSSAAVPAVAPREPSEKPAAAAPPSNAMNAESRVLRGQALMQQGQMDAAMKELSSVIKQFPNCARAFLERGNVHFQREQWAEAIKDYTEAIAVQANFISAFHMRAQAYLKLKQFDDAANDYQDARKLDPENAQIKALKMEIHQVRAASSTFLTARLGPGEDEEDAFAGIDTPKEFGMDTSKKLCMVCMDCERGCRLRPCLHAALCVECAENLKARGHGCPICNTIIEQVEQGAFMHTFAVEEAQSIAAAAAGALSPKKSPTGASYRAGVRAGGGMALLPAVREDEDQMGINSGELPAAETQGAAVPAAAAGPAD